MAQIAQQEAMESDDREGIILEYLETPLPTNWQEMTLYERWVYLGDKNAIESRCSSGRPRVFRDPWASCRSPGHLPIC